jgi:hypothetical protein
VAASIQIGSVMSSCRAARAVPGSRRPRAACRRRGGGAVASFRVAAGRPKAGAAGRARPSALVRLPSIPPTPARRRWWRSTPPAPCRSAGEPWSRFVPPPGPHSPASGPGVRAGVKEGSWGVPPALPSAVRSQPAVSSAVRFQRRRARASPGSHASPPGSASWLELAQPSTRRASRLSVRCSPVERSSAGAVCAAAPPGCSVMSRRFRRSRAGALPPCSVLRAHGSCPPRRGPALGIAARPHSCHRHHRTVATHAARPGNAHDFVEPAQHR